MTIAVAVRTGSAVVFAADSKLTTSGIVGFEQDGSPRLVEQTYDNATKVVHDRVGTVMAMVAGEANIGNVTALDFVSTLVFPNYAAGGNTDEQQDIGLFSIVIEPIVAQRYVRWQSSQVPSERWPGTTLLLAAAGPDRRTPRVWRLRLNRAHVEASEILKIPGIRLEGAYNEVASLLYGYEWSVLDDLTQLLGVEAERLRCGLHNLRVLQPIFKLNLDVMPIQDAVELAVFLANVQIQMDRFLPGTPACGGPIDVMVLQMAPQPEIIEYPGKVLHHPAQAEYTRTR